MSRNNPPPIPQTQKDAFDTYTVDTLKGLAKKFPASGNFPQRKHELIDFLVKRASTDDIFDILSDIQKTVLAETAHCTGNVYDRTRFIAKYGQDPYMRAKSEYSYSPSLLDLFIINYVMPDDVGARIRKIFPEPQANAINCFELLPEEIVQSEKHYDGEHKIPVEVQERTTKYSAIQNFETVLRIIESGKIKISSSSRCPTGASMTLLADHLAGADWYGQPCYGGIQTFAWPLLMQASGFAAASAASRSITSKGNNVLLRKTPVYEAIKTAWDSWKSKALIDEFSRIS